MTVREMCVVYVLRERAGVQEVLLGHKRIGGRVVGMGGKVEAGETVRQAAVREVAEECLLQIREDDLQPAGIFDYISPATPAWSQRSHVFVCRDVEGEVGETDEIIPAWYALDDVPFERMWDDARRWLPGVLRGGRASATFTYGEDLTTVVNEAPLSFERAG